MKMIDPPGGWRYGFPKAFTIRDGQSLREWLIENGYPAHEIDLFPPDQLPVRIWRQVRPEASPDMMAQAELKAFCTIADRWKLSEGEQMVLLGLSSPELLRSWKAGDIQALAPETIERLGHVSGIFQAINIIFWQPNRADAWMRALNTAPLFGGEAALSRMCCGTVEDLRVVHRFLKAEVYG